MKSQKVCELRQAGEKEVAERERERERDGEEVEERWHGVRNTYDG